MVMRNDIVAADTPASTVEVSQPRRGAPTRSCTEQDDSAARRLQQVHRTHVDCRQACRRLHLFVILIAERCYSGGEREAAPAKSAADAEQQGAVVRPCLITDVAPAPTRTMSPLGMVPTRSNHDGAMMSPSIVATVTPLVAMPESATSALAAVPAAYAVRVALAVPVDTESDWFEFGLAKHASGLGASRVGGRRRWIL
ncbi:hypothetical protein DFH08DRAFT_1043444 [Mycena albidolilacea]|uniref:Uncharacterized protein n=1 Tax=Mycena albidolilacea TaxID=1033008 RepID=A0AAD7AGY0_9AGAR|nr:hypothetical protein DFH08DRAFT_1043444 [Mycena albidolilacea]